MPGPDPTTTEWVPLWTTGAIAPLPHAPTHSDLATDPVDVKNLAGYPGGTTTFLRGDKTFAGASLVLPWTSVPIASLAFSTNGGGGVWTVPAISYFKYAVIDKVLFIKCAITGTSVVGAGSELRVLLTGIPLTIGGNDSFGFQVYTQDGFATQDVGQTITRVSNNSLVFKTRTGVAWTAGGGAVTGVIANMIGELA